MRFSFASISTIPLLALQFSACGALFGEESTAKSEEELMESFDWNVDGVCEASTDWILKCEAEWVEDEEIEARDLMAACVHSIRSAGKTSSDCFDAQMDYYACLSFTPCEDYSAQWECEDKLAELDWMCD